MKPRLLLDLVRWLAGPFLLGVCLLGAAPLAAAQTATAANTPLDHLSTGFALTGAHARARCESCHQNGQLAGTPRDCASCHVAGRRLSQGNTVMPALHLRTTRACDSCHNTRSFAGARFDHVGVVPGSCASCHNGGVSTGKPSAHLLTTASCDSCHRSSGWLPAKGFDHAGVTPGSCQSCHNGSRASGKAANHVPYQTVAGAAAATCDSCHRGGFSTWAGARLHASLTVTGSCTSCHTGAFPPAEGKPGNALHGSVTGNCESCHKSTSSWSAARVDHSTFNAATNCAGCHNGGAATGKPGAHIPTGAATCYACHHTTGWAPTKWNHSQVPVTAQCASCHTGGHPPAEGKPGNHVPYTAVPVTASANCDSCHKGSFTTWTNGRVHANVSLGTNCSSCHNGAYPPAEGKPGNALHASVTGNCESCHKSSSSWGSARVDHSSFNAATNCAGCHNGSAATGKPGNHIPTGAATCYACHHTTGWAPTKWNHTQVPVTAQCASCHTGGYPPADGKPGNHVPYTAVPVTASANCDSCHKGSFTTWATGRVHASVSLSTNCSTCHTGAYPPAVGKPGNAIHATVTGNCEGCHKSTTSWSSVSFAHSPANAVGTGTCDTCHNGSTATGKPAGHIPVPAGVARCDSCHRSQASWTSSVAMNHGAVATATCKSCHGGSYTGQGATAKPANHIPEVQLLAGATMDCKACHASTSSFGSMTMNHNGSQGSGAGWCKACHDRATSYLGSMERKALTHEKSTGVIDCSQSGCHRPLGTKGRAYTAWD